MKLKFIIMKYFNSLVIVVCLLFMTSLNISSQAYTASSSSSNYVSTANYNYAFTGSYGDDDVVYSVPMGFNIPYFGVNYSTVHVSSNGWMSFIAPAGSYPTNQDISSGSYTGPDGIIALYWDDLVASGANDYLLTGSGGSAPNRYFVVEWYSYSWYCGGGYIYMQCVFYETSGIIDFNYGFSSGASWSDPSCASASIGIRQPSSGGSLYYCGANCGASYNSGSAPTHYRFTPVLAPAADFSASTTSTNTGTSITFTDASTNTPTSWAWDFGDGSTSASQNPSHTYTSAGTYTVALTATNAGGSDTETKSSYMTITVPVPVADFSASTTTATTGEAVVFTDASTNTPTSWSWDFGDGNTSTAQNPSHTYTSAGTYTVALTATNAGGSDTETKSSYMTINPPVPVADFSASTTNTDDQTAITFTDASTNTPTSWSWDFGDGSSGSTSQNPSHTYSVAGTYTVALTATNAGGSDTETKTDYITITSSCTNPTVTVNSATTCSGSTATMTATPSGGSGVYTTYTWSVPTGESAPGNVASFSASTAGTYTVAVSDNAGCTSAYASGTLTVNSLPTVTVNSPSTCAGSTVAVTASPSGGSSSYSTYTWTVPTGESAPGNVATFNASTAGSYSVTVTDNNSCTSSSASGNLTVNSLPTVTLNSPSICTGGSATMTASPSGGSSTYSTYTWTVPTGESAPGNVASFSASTAGSYSVTVTDNNSCTSSSASGTLTDGGYTNTWDGSSGTSWSDASNWSCGTVPSSSSLVVIADVTNQPVISGNSTISTLTVNSGAEISVSSNALTVTGATDLNGKLIISEGTFNADGSFDGNTGTTEFTGGGVLALSSTVTNIGSITNTSSTGTVKYDGTSAQNVDAPSSGSYANLSIENASTKTAVGNIDVDGNLNTEAEASCVLDMSTYDLNVAGDFTIGQRGGLLASNTSCDVTFDGASTAFAHAGSQASSSSVSDVTTDTFDESWPSGTPSNTWTYNVLSGGGFQLLTSGYLRYIYSSTQSANAGAFSSAITLQAGDVVDVSWKDISGTFNENYSIFLIKENTIATAANGYLLYSVSNFTTNSWTTRTAQVTVGTTAASLGTGGAGTYYLLFYVTSSADQFYVGIDDVDIDITRSTTTTTFTSINPAFNNVAVNGGDVTLSSPMDISGTLTLTSGNIISQTDVQNPYSGTGTNNSNSQTYAATNTITLKDGATISGASASSHVVGAVRRESSGTSALEFPTGDGTNYRPVYLTPAASTATTYTAEFVNAAHSSIAYDNDGYNNTPVNTGVNHVANGCWWDIEKSSGGANAYIGINWDANSGVDTPADMLLTHWNSSTSKWDNVTALATAGSGSGVPAASTGRITSSSAQSDFSPWNLGSSSSSNTLPIDLLSFHTDCSHDIVDVNFSVVSQVNNDYFLIERSTDAMEWEVVGQIEGAGNSNTQMDYIFTDSDPIANLSYYRLTQVDYDGTVKSFYPVSATCGSFEGGLPIDVYPNPAFNEITVELELDNFQGDDVYYTISDATGKIALSDYIRLDRGFNKHQLDVSKLPNGVYVLKFNQTKNHITETRIVKR